MIIANKSWGSSNAQRKELHYEDLGTGSRDHSVKKSWVNFQVVAPWPHAQLAVMKSPLPAGETWHA